MKFGKKKLVDLIAGADWHSHCDWYCFVLIGGDIELWENRSPHDANGYPTKSEFEFVHGHNLSDEALGALAFVTSTRLTERQRRERQDKQVIAFAELERMIAKFRGRVGQ